jgi:hypothetical protein
MIRSICLEELTPVRFFKGNKKERLEYIKIYGLWENDSHFIRAAVQHFMTHLNRSNIQQSTMHTKKQRRNYEVT